MKKNIFFILLGFVSVLVLLIIIDIKNDILTSIPFVQEGTQGRFYGKITIFFVTLAALYYPVRTCTMIIRKTPLSHPILITILTSATKLLRKTHPYVGILAFFCAMVHGYVLFVKLYEFAINSFTLSGLSLASMFIIVSIPGFILTKKSYLKVRTVHKLCAFFMTALIITHLFIVTS